MRNARLRAVAIFSLACAVGAAYAKAPAPPPPVPEAAVKRVKGVVPKGWTVSIKNDTLTVRRDKPVSLFNPIGAPDEAPQQLASDWEYEVRLKFRARVGPEDHAKQQKENVQREEQIEKMREGLRAAKIPHRFDDWLPNSDLQQEMVIAYRAEQKRLHQLPDLYSDTHSLDVADSLDHILVFTNAAEREECDSVKKAVCKLFKPYRAENPNP